jgi:hypothetical protein
MGSLKTEDIKRGFQHTKHTDFVLVYGEIFPYSLNVKFRHQLFNPISDLEGDLIH